MKRVIWIVIQLSVFSTLFSQSYKIKVPEIPGIQVKVGKSVKIPTPGPVKTALAFRFRDGRIVTGSGSNSMWSYDHGRTWQTGPGSRMDKAAEVCGAGFGVGDIFCRPKDNHGKFYQQSLL